MVDTEVERQSTGEDASEEEFWFAWEGWLTSDLRAVSEFHFKGCDPPNQDYNF